MRYDNREAASRQKHPSKTVETIFQLFFYSNQSEENVLLHCHSTTLESADSAELIQLYKMTKTCQGASSLFVASVLRAGLTACLTPELRADAESIEDSREE